MAENPEAFFTTPHFNGYAAVLVRLDRITVEKLRQIVTEAWLARAPRAPSVSTGPAASERAGSGRAQGQRAGSQGLIQKVAGQDSAAAINGNAVAPSTASRMRSA